jgi:zinc protease
MTQLAERARARLHMLPTHERVLSNGLSVLVREDRSAAVVAIVTYVKAGYFDEPDHLTGISHVLEHMYFKGTERRSAGQLAEETKLAGGYLNAGTIYDHTSYYTVLPSSSLEAGLDIQSDALRNSKIDAEELRKELLVIIQEANRKLDNPSAVAGESMFELLFRRHRMRRWRIGTEERLKTFTRDDVLGFYKAQYQPSDIVLVVTGDVDPHHVFDRIDHYYGDIQAGRAPLDRGPTEPPRSTFAFREMSGDIVRTHLEWGWQTPAALHPDTPALDLLAVALGQGRASRLYRQVRERGLVSGIGTSNYTPDDVGVFSVDAELEPADTAAALEAIAGSVSAALAEPLAAEELERARNILEARLLRQTETMEGQARMLAEWQAMGDWRLADQYIERIAILRTEDLHRVAREYLPFDRSALLVYRPRTADTDALDPARVKELIARVTPPATRLSHRAATPLASPATRTARAPGRVEDDVHFYALDGAGSLVIRPRRSSALVSMAIAVRGGVVDETLEHAGVTAFMARLSIKGSERRSAAQLAEESEALGGVISPSVTSDLVSWSISVPSRHMQHGFDLLADTALHAAFPSEEVERERKIALSDLHQLRDDMHQYPLRLFIQRAFAGHPYGHPLSANEQTTATADAAELQRWHRRVVLENAPCVLVVGDVDPDEAAAAIMGQLPSFSAAGKLGQRRTDWPVAGACDAEQREKAQTALVLGFPGPDRNHPDLYTMQVIANIASGLGGRFFEELRSRRSLAYTVTASPLARRSGGAFVAYIATSPEREHEARAGLLHEFEKLVAKPVLDEELQRAKQYLIGTWQIRRQTNGAQLSDLAHALLLGNGLEELREFTDRINAISAQDVRTAAERYFDPSRLVEAVVRGSMHARPAR